VIDARGRTIPGLIAVDHVSITVPDVDAAAEFFVDVLGARELYRRAYAAKGTDDMRTRFNAHPDAHYRLAKVELSGTIVEVFEYRAPDLNPVMPRNCDAGGHHIGLRVADLDAALAAVAEVPGVRILGSPSTMTTSTGAVRRWVYFLTPWGLQMELAEERSA
jgi:catechol 2,3-dioxygenase-like lactoylglutathione lyase family enzyme